MDNLCIVISMLYLCDKSILGNTSGSSYCEIYVFCNDRPICYSKAFAGRDTADYVSSGHLWEGKTMENFKQCSPKVVTYVRCSVLREVLAIVI